MIMTRMVQCGNVNMHVFTKGHNQSSINSTYNADGAIRTRAAREPAKRRILENWMVLVNMPNRAALSDFKRRCVLSAVCCIGRYAFRVAC